jgi:hypothetical protein
MRDAVVDVCAIRARVRREVRCARGAIEAVSCILTGTQLTIQRGTGTRGNNNAVQSSLEAKSFVTVSYAANVTALDGKTRKMFGVMPLYKPDKPSRVSVWTSA